MKFQKYMSRSHLANANVALYTQGTKAQLRAVGVPGGRAFGARYFDTPDAAQQWYESLKGSGVGRLQNAFDALRFDDERYE